jgi:phosphoribosylanthranilate isomerase
MSSPVKIKICGVTTIDDAIMVAECGADAIGFNFYPPSPRSVSPSVAMSLIQALTPFVAPVGVFVKTPMRQATAIAFQLGLRAIQTVDEIAQTESATPFAHIPVFRIAIADDVSNAKTFCQNHRPAAILIDSHVPGQMGGTGRTAPWDLLAGVNFGVPVILAGGLTPDTVGEAIRIVRPWAVDVASGVESSPGRKDRGMVRDFIKTVRAIRT